jgi:hypothetical protein
MGWPWCGSAVEPAQAGAPHVPRVEGVLRLVFRERGGATYLADQYGRAPLKVVRPFSLGGGTALVQLTLSRRESWAGTPTGSTSRSSRGPGSS